MNSKFGTETAFELGTAAADRSVDHGEVIMAHDKKRRELVNAAEITESKAELKILADERDDIRRFVGNLLQGDLNVRFSFLYFIAIAAILMAGGVSFTHLAFQPFGLGWQSWVYAVSLACVCSALADVILERYGSPRVVGAAAAIGLVAGLVGLVLVAYLRGDVLGMYLKAALSDGNQNTGPAADATQFYEASVHRLQLLFSLLAVALEIATGLMVWEARRISIAPLSAIGQAKKRLSAIEPEMIRLAARIVFLQNEPAIFEAEFLRDFHRGLKCGAERRGVRWMAALTLTVVGVTGARRASGQPVTVIVPDITRSTTVARSVGGRSEYQKNLDASAELLSRLPAGTRFSVLGITEATYSRPVILLSGQIPSDPGPLEFVNRIEIARIRAAKQFVTAASQVIVTAQRTDVIGAFFVASEILQHGPEGQRNLIFLSDMRQSATPLDIESPTTVAVKAALSIVDHHHLFPDLHGVDVWIIGVDAAGKDVAYISSLREFWTAFLARSGAHLQTFSMMRDLPDLSHAASKGNHP